MLESRLERLLRLPLRGEPRADPVKQSPGFHLEFHAWVIPGLDLGFVNGSGVSLSVLFFQLSLGYTWGYTWGMPSGLSCGLYLGISCVCAP